MRVSGIKTGLGAAAVLLLAAVCATVWAQGGGRMDRVKDFKRIEYHDAGPAGQTARIRSLVSGTEALPAYSNLIWVQQMKVEGYELDGRTNLVARAPSCLLDQRNEIASSTSRLEVALSEGRLYIEGTGFWFSVSNRHLIISNRVRTVIQPELLRTKP